MELIHRLNSNRRFTTARSLLCSCMLQQAGTQMDWVELFVHHPCSIENRNQRRKAINQATAIGPETKTESQFSTPATITMLGTILSICMMYIPPLNEHIVLNS